MPLPRLLVAFGGRSSEHEISLRSAESLIGAVDRARYEPVLLGIRRDGAFRTGAVGTPLRDVVAHGQAVEDLRALAPDLVFPVLHGPFGEDGTFQGMLEVLGIPYVGSGVFASAVCMDKIAQKRMVEPLGVPLLPWLQVDGTSLATPGVLAGLQARVAEELGFPCFVKPANMGSSVGVHRVASAAELDAALLDAARYDHRIVVERGVPHPRELELAVLGNGDANTQVSGVGEIRLPEGTWYDYETKYEKDVAELCIPAEVSPELLVSMQQHALAAFRAADCRGLARVDFFVDPRDGVAYLNELNTMPGFTSISMYPKLMAAAGVDYTALVTELCELGLAAFDARRGLRIDR